MSTMRAPKLAAFALSVAAAIAACSGGSHPKPTPAATDSTAPIATATAAITPPHAPSPTPVDYPEPATIPLTYGGPVDFPSGIVMYARDASWEGPSNAIRRYYRSPDGVFHAEPLLESVWNFEDESKMRAISSTASTINGNQIAATLCHGSCYGGPQPVTVVRSIDGGITWSDLGDHPEGGWVAAIKGDQVWFGDSDWKVVSLPSGEWINVRGHAQGTLLLSSPGLGSGAVLWIGREKALHDAITGLTIANLPVPGRYEVISIRPFTDLSGRSVIFVNWTALGAREQFIGLLDPPTSSWRRVIQYSYDNSLGGFYPAGWLDDTRLFVRADLKRGLLGGSPPNMEDIHAGIPAILDVTTGVVSPIREFIADGVANKAGGPAPFAVATGTLARVTAPGDCLNVRKAADLSSESFGCFADRVLLQVTGDAASGWLPVLAPDGRPGYAFANFLTPATR